MGYNSSNQTLTVDCVLPGMEAPYIAGTLQGFPLTENAVVCSVPPCSSSARKAVSFGFKYKVGAGSKVFTINAVANSIYQIITEKALHFATVVTAVMSRGFFRRSQRNGIVRQIPEQRKIHSRVLLSCAGGLRL